MTAEQVWASVAEQAAKLKLIKSDMLFGIPQDASATTVCVAVKDANDKVVGRVHWPMAIRQKTVEIGDEIFLIEFPLSWNRTAILRGLNSAGIVAKYTRTSWLGRHEYDIAGYGVINSERASLSLRIPFNFRMGERLIGMRQKISSAREKGDIVLLPSDIPLQVRIFVLTVW
jgi:hypothetical protein